MSYRIYKVVVFGMGKRGRHHAAAFFRNPRFQLAGISTRDPQRLDEAARELPGVRASTNLPDLIKEARPDVFCFCTPPHVRLEMIRLGIESGARLISYEKPMALCMNEAIEIRRRVRAAGVKSVVSHQHRFGEPYRKVKEILERGAIGRVHTVYAHGAGWMMHLSTHFIDYMRWFSGNVEAEWVMAQAAGGRKLSDPHPSADYLAGFIQFANGMRGIVECGAGAPDVPEVNYWWRKNRLGAQGTEGFAEVLTGAGWRAATREGLSSGPGCMNYEADTTAYVDAIADWLDDDERVHPCHGESAYKGFEIAMALLRSVAERGQVALPLKEGEPEVEAIRRVLGASTVLATPAHSSEYR